MNDKRRAVLSDVSNALAAQISAIEAVRDEEQESFDNLSENLQQGERGQAMEQAVSDLDEAINSVQEAVDKLGEVT